MATDVAPDEQNDTDSEYSTVDMSPMGDGQPAWDPLAWPEQTVSPVQVRW